MPKNQNEIMLKLLVWLLTGVLGMNMFFLKRLVDTIDSAQAEIKATNNIVWQLRQDVVVLQAKFDTIQQQQRGKENE